MNDIDHFGERPDVPDSWRISMAKMFLDMTVDLEAYKNQCEKLEEKCKQLERDAAEMHHAVNHKRGHQTIQSFSRTHHLELSREEAQKHGVTLWHRLKKSGRLSEINKTDELTVGAKNDKVNEYSVKCLTEYFHDIGLI